MSMKFIPRFISAALAISFLFYVPVPSAYAATNEVNYWRWWYINQQSNADIADAENTDYGISAGEYAKNKTGFTVDDAIQEVTDQYNNAVNATANGIDYYYNAVRDVYNHSVDYAERGAYMAEDALRKTVDTAGNYVYAVNSSDFWNGFYNSMYNGGGYNDQYAQSENNGYTATSDNGVTYNVNYVGIGTIYGSVTWCSGGSSTDANPNNRSGSFVFSINNGSETAYFKSRTNWGFTDWNNHPSTLVYSYGTRTITATVTFEKSDHSGYWTDSAYVDIFSGTLVSGNTTNTPVLQPSQMGYVIDPTTGIRYPVYTDSTLNPFIINPDGTVTFPNGDIVPIYVDPEEISDDGWLWILDYIDKQDNTKPSQNPFGQPWNTQDDGTVLGGLFNNLLQDISSLFDDIANKINDLLNRLINLITDALKKFFILLVGDVDQYGNLFESSDDSHVDMIEELYNLLLQVVGVDN